MVTLPDILTEAPPQFTNRYEYIKSVAASGFQSYQTIGYLTDHGVQHCETVEANLSYLLPEARKQELSPEEIFLVLCAAHFHDIGLVTGREEESWQDVREEHVDRSYDYLHEHYDDWGLNRFEAYALKNICLGHSGDTLYDLPETMMVHHDPVRIRFLAALLRVADELDLTFTRVSGYLREMRDFPDDSLLHWVKHEQVSGVRIEPVSWTIEIHVMPRDEAGKVLVEEMIAQKVQEELDYVRPVFEQNDIYYRSVTMRYWDFGEKRAIRPDDPPAEKETRRLILARSDQGGSPSEEKLSSSDVYSAYENGLEQLLTQLGPEHPLYSEALVYQNRLSENIAQSRRYGNTGSRKAERMEIIAQLNRFALSAIGTPFSELY